MINYIKIRNFKSFGNEVTIDFMQKVTPDIEGHGVMMDKRTASHVKGYFGIGSTGKTNLVEGIAFLKYLVVNSMLFDDDMRSKTYYPFYLSEKDSDASYEIQFTMPNGDSHDTYTYGFTYNESKILKERLMVRKANSRKSALVFSREEGNIDLRGVVMKGKTEFIKIAGRKDNTLILTMLMYFDKIGTSKVAHALIDSLGAIVESSYSSESTTLSKRLLNDENFRNMVLGYVHMVNPDIKGFAKDIWWTHPDGTPFINAIQTVGDNDILVKETNIPRSIVAIMKIAGAVDNALKRGSLLCIDDFGEELCIQVKERILEMFLDGKSNVNNAQLLFTSDDTRLMERLGREEIGFIEKAENGFSSVKELISLKTMDGKKVRKDSDYAKAFIKGNYDRNTKLMYGA